MPSAEGNNPPFGTRGGKFMRICLYTNTWRCRKVGGQEIVVDSLARQFLSLGHEPVVSDPLAEIAGSVLMRLRYPMTVAWHPRFLSTRCFCVLVWTLDGKAASPRRFDVIHCHGTYPAGLRGLLAARQWATCRWSSPATATTSRLGGLYDRKSELRERYRTALAGARRRDCHQRLLQARCFARPIPSCGRSSIFPTAST